MSNLFDLSGKVAIVTGASRGLGREIALGYARVGADIVISSRNLEACEAVAAQVRSLGRRASAIACDMSSWAEIDRLVESTYEHFGRCDVLVNNAGITQDPVMLTETTEELFDKFYQINTKGPMHLASEVAKKMAGSGGGSIVNVVSMGGIKPGSPLAMYCSSKAAFNALNRVMAEEWAQMGIRVNAIAPGPFLTEMLSDIADALPGYVEYAASITLLKRVAQPDEIIGPALFLASDASSYVTGQTLAVCGGAT